MPLLFIANRSSSISNVLIPIIEKAFGNRIEFPSKKREKKKTKKGKDDVKNAASILLDSDADGGWVLIPVYYVLCSKENITLILTSSFFLRGVVLLYERGRSRI